MKIPIDPTKRRGGSFELRLICQVVGFKSQFVVIQSYTDIINENDYE